MTSLGLSELAQPNVLIERRKKIERRTTHIEVLGPAGVTGGQTILATNRSNKYMYVKPCDARHEPVFPAFLNVAQH